MTQQAQFAQSFANERLFSRLATAFGVLAAALVAAGLYGTLSYRVGRRTREIAVRMALGAERGQVLRMVLGDSLAVCTAGILVGLPLAIAGSRFLESILFGLTSTIRCPSPARLPPSRSSRWWQVSFRRYAPCRLIR